MKVFTIGGTGYVGRGVVRALLAAGNQVTALARSQEAAARLPAGATVLPGSLSDRAVLQEGLRDADAVIYAAIAGMQGITPEDDAAIALILEAFSGSGRPFIMTSGLGVYAGTKTPMVDEDTRLDDVAPSQAWRAALERRLVAAAAERDLRSIIIRPPIVYGEARLPPPFRAAMVEARAAGRSFYIADGANRIPVVHVDDLGRAYALALAQAPGGALFNVVAEDVTGRDLARALGLAVGLDGEAISLTRAEADAALGPAAGALAGNFVVSRVKTTAVLGWRPTESGVLYDLAHGSMKALAASL